MTNSDYPDNNDDTAIFETTEPGAPLSAREQVLAREESRYGGMKFGSAFFGWLTATSIAALLAALVAGIGTALGVGTQEVTDAIAGNEGTVGVLGAVAVLLILFIAYFCGGYVTGRMARFNGAKQGLAVWIWAIIIAAVLALIGAFAGSRFDWLANLNAFPWLPIDQGMLTITGIVTAVLALGVSLGGAVLGGSTGMRFHRAVDRVGLGDRPFMYA
jgi:hypothetical protein